MSVKVDNYGLAGQELLSYCNSNGKRIAFIHSLGRSGSTYLQNFFMGLGEGYCYPLEWNVMEKYHKRVGDDGRMMLGKFIEYYRIDSKMDETVLKKLYGFSGTELEARVSVSEFLEIIRKLMCENDDCVMIIKTTDLGNFWLYDKFMPESKQVVNIRCPVEYIHSWHMFWMKSNYPIWPSHWSRPLHMQALERIEACFRQASIFQENSNVRIIRLEDIDLSDVDQLVKIFKSLVVFFGLNAREDEKYNQLVEKKAGVNASVKMSEKEKQIFYRSLGLCKLENNMLTELDMFIKKFYPDHLHIVKSTKKSNYLLRYARYYWMYNGENNSRLIKALKIVKRMMTINRLVSSK